MEININYVIIINDLKLDKIIKKSEKKLFLKLEDGSEIRRNDIKSIYSICDECEKHTILTNLPENFILFKEVYKCKSCRQKGNLNGNFGKLWTEQKKIERSKKYSGDNNPMYNKTFYEIWVKKYGKEEADKKLSKHNENCARNGENNGMFGKSFYDIWIEKYGKEKANEKLNNIKEKHRNNLLDNPEKHNEMIINSHKAGYRKTSIEKIVEDYLSSKNINHKYNFILNKYQFDFILKDINVIIEIQGDYWHGNPNIYSDIDMIKKPLNENQKYKIKMDKIKAEYIKENTKYQIIYLWETEINNGEFKKILKKWNL